MKTPKADYDSAWKEALRLYFPAFLQFFFPMIYDDIDWTREFKLLDKELLQVLRGARSGRRAVDCLVQVTRRNGHEEWVLIHVEVQSQYDPDFERRVALYYSRIIDRYGRDVCTLAILGDDDPDWRPSSFRRELWGCAQQLRFPVAKLLDFPPQAERPHNPFSWLVAGQRQAHITRKDPQARQAVVIRMLRGLYSSGLDRESIVGFFRLLDWVLALPKELEYAVTDEIALIERSMEVAHITSVERVGLRRGRKQGRAEGLREAVLQVLKTRWNLAHPSLLETLQAVSDEKRLSALLESALLAASPEQWMACLPEPDFSPIQ